MMTQANLALITRVALICAVLLLTRLGTLKGAESAADKPASARLALLIGVKDYPNLGPSEQLDGCCNDVEAIRETLIERFRFQNEDIATITDTEATGAAIRHEMEKLLQRIHALPANSPPAQVMYYFSGHGSQLPDQEEGHPDCDEEDGLDETLVPHDAEKQGGDQDIRDDELYRFAEEVCANDRARLWIVLDCCHSGSGARGATKIRRLERGVVPLAPASTVGRRILRKKLPVGAVCLSACRDSEAEPEFPSENQIFGLLTRFLVQVLREDRFISKLSHDLLRDAIVTRYQRAAVTQAPTPVVEGDAGSLQSVVLGGGTDAARYCKVLPTGRDRRRVLLTSGAFHGVTLGSLYELYERPEQIVWQTAGTDDTENPSLAWLRIEHVEGASARAQVFQWEDAQHTDSSEIVLPRSFKQGFAVKRHHQHGDFGVRLRVVKAIDEKTDSPPLAPGDRDLAPVIHDALDSLKRPDESKWLTWVEGEEPCDLLLRIDGLYAALFPATGMTESPSDESATESAIPPSLRGGWGPIDLRDAGTARKLLQEYLRRFTRVRNLIRLAAEQGESDRSPIQVEIELLSVDLTGYDADLDKYDEVGQTRLWTPEADQSLVMHQNDFYALRVRNREKSDTPIYVTVLAIDPDLEIQVVLPYQEGVGQLQETNLEPGAERISDPFKSIEPLGLHYAIVLATREPNDFYMLAQPALPKVKGKMRGTDSSLRELLLQQTYFQARGGQRMRPQRLFDESWSAAILRWEAILRR